MYAIIKAGGKQYKVSEGDELFIEKLEVEAGDTVEFAEVLAVGGDGGLKVGKPFVEGAKVKADVIKQGRAKKILVMKYRPKKGYRRKQGHRQPYTKVQITGIEA